MEATDTSREEAEYSAGAIDTTVAQRERKQKLEGDPTSYNPRQCARLRQYDYDGRFKNGIIMKI